ncbi:MAG TPA: hypothetical protein VEY07_04445 [Thermoplasmata archaeon]|nr:hypothetical protein [Thermoplasmata archaeon]
MEDGELPRDPLLLLADPLTGGGEWSLLRPLLVAPFTLVEPDIGEGSERAARQHAPARPYDLAQTLIGTGEYPAHLLASTFAAGPALHLAVERPDLLRSLLLFDPVVVDPTGREGLADVARRFGPLAERLIARRWVEAEAEWRSVFALRPRRSPSPASAEALIGPGGDRWLAEWKEPGPWAIPAGISEFLPPTLLLDGEGSPEFVHDAVRALTNRLPNVRHLRLRGADHLLPRTDPARVAGIVISFCLERNVPSA